ncbi:hypothetical protein M0Q97_07275 [Candidatus Dojkabacteria bacterium]|jgi:hypothetical protein|nr:hypothetical protein [Candidatus Dojkabacteria bacterium]
MDLSKIKYLIKKDSIELSDTSKIIFLYENDICGHIEIIEYFDLIKFEKFFDEDDFLKKFKWDKFLFIENLNVSIKFRYKGIGNYMMKNFLSEIIPLYFSNYNIIGLYAEPYELNIDLSTLKSFYKKFGFKILNIKQWINPCCPEEELPPNNYMFKILK